MNEEIASAILEQMGGMHRLHAMVGATQFVYIENGLKFRFKGSRRANGIRIKLNANDEYDVLIYQIRKVDWKVVDEATGLQWDDLIPYFERVTGLYLSL